MHKLAIIPAKENNTKFRYFRKTAGLYVNASIVVSLRHLNITWANTSKNLLCAANGNSLRPTCSRLLHPLTVSLVQA